MSKHIIVPNWSWKISRELVFRRENRLVLVFSPPIPFIHNVTFTDNLINALLLSSDDLLNYELGDDLDDQELAADEDALLLSDEGRKPFFVVRIFSNKTFFRTLQRPSWTSKRHLHNSRPRSRENSNTQQGIRQRLKFRRTIISLKSKKISSRNRRVQQLTSPVNRVLRL